MQGLARSCCSTIVVPPMENDLPLYFKSSDASINIKSFVSNGNRLIMTGGSFTSLVFLNRYFKFDLKKVIYDKGPFEKQPMSADPETSAIIQRLPAALPQEGMAVTSVDLHSLPSRTTAIYATFTSTPMFEMTFCEKPLGYPLRQACDEECDFMQRGLRGYWCGYNKGMMCTEQATPEECEAIAASNEAKNESVPCSCGSIVYDGYDFVGNHKTWMGASVWDSTLRSAVELPEMGEEGVATWPAPPPPPPPPAPGPFWNLRVFSSHYPLRHAPDLNRLAYVGDASWDAHIDIDSRSSITDLIEGLDDYYGQGSYPAGSWAGVFYGRLYIEVEGMYTWCSTSIDGSRIFVGGVQVLANDQRHGKPTGEACVLVVVCGLRNTMSIPLVAGAVRWQLPYFRCLHACCSRPATREMLSAAIWCSMSPRDDMSDVQKTAGSTSSRATRCMTWPSTSSPHRRNFFSRSNTVARIPMSRKRSSIAGRPVPIPHPLLLPSGLCAHSRLDIPSTRSSGSRGSIMLVRLVLC